MVQRVGTEGVEAVGAEPVAEKAVVPRRGDELNAPRVPAAGRKG